MSNILVFSENRELLCEMLGKACELASDNQGVVASGWDSDEEYAKFGADKSYIFDKLSESGRVEDVVPCLKEIVSREDASIILIGATKRGKEIAARIAAAKDAVCITDCKEIGREGSTVEVQRMVYGGMALKVEKIERFPLVVTVLPRMFAKKELQKDIRSEAMSIPTDSKINLIERKTSCIQVVDVEAADRVVVVGRGFEKKEDLSMAQELADVIGGVLACTRPIAEDYRWMPEGVYVGLTGKSSKGKLNISLGASGQIHYVAGIVDANVTVAIDANEQAPIWNATDYGIVGDLYSILPELIAEIKKNKI